MSYTDEDAARDDFYDRIREELRPEIIEEFQGGRLISYFESNRMIAEKPFRALAEARNLHSASHETAAFIHAVIASEVTIKSVFIYPLVIGVVNNEILAPLITDMVLGQTRGQFDKAKTLFLKVLNEITRLDFETYSRTGSSKRLLEEISEIQKKRNQILHNADLASKQETEFALTVAAELLETIFPKVAKALGYHIHGRYRLCRNYLCSQPKHFLRMLKKKY